MIDRHGDANAESERALARRMWALLEPYHACGYFAPEPREATESLGLSGGWLSYFGLRAAPLGPTPSLVVTAVFYGFAPGLVARAIPAAWAATTDALLDARLSAMDRVLRRLLGDQSHAERVGTAADLARTAAEATPTAGRPLGAANAALPWPESPHLRLWHAATVLREARGDAHVAALVAAGIDPVESLVLQTATGRVQREVLQARRGWSDAEWTASVERLCAEGRLDSDGGLTESGEDLLRWVERRTDDAMRPAWTALGADGADRLRESAAPVIRAVFDGGGIPAANPGGMRPEEALR